MGKRDRLGEFSLDAKPIHDFGEWLCPYIASPQSETSAVALVYPSISPRMSDRPRDRVSFYLTAAEARSLTPSKRRTVLRSKSATYEVNDVGICYVGWRAIGRRRWPDCGPIRHPIEPRLVAGHHWPSLDIEAVHAVNHDQ